MELTVKGAERRILKKPDLYYSDPQYIWLVIMNLMHNLLSRQDGTSKDLPHQISPCYFLHFIECPSS